MGTENGPNKKESLGKDEVRLSKIDRRHRLIRNTLLLATFTGLTLIAVSAWFTQKLPSGIPQIGLPSLATLNKGVEIYDRNDKLVCTIYREGQRENVPLGKISKNMRNAIIAAEDHRFFEHIGVDPVGIARAAQTNYQAGQIVEGASTITQQLVRNLYLNPKDRSYSRKVVEAIAALRIDTSYSKDKILETYLNVAYFGGGMFGIEKASQYYFDKHAKDLTVAESAFLAGLVKSPSTLSVDKDAAIARQHEILDEMVRYNIVPQEQADIAKKTDLKLVYKKDPVLFGHYMNAVKARLQQELGDDLWNHKWKVYTHLDVTAQEQAEKTLNSRINRKSKGINQGALVSVALEDGGIRALVGGVGPYKENQYNRATHPHTVGSVFKPFVYLAALNYGIIENDTMIDDSPLVIGEGKDKYEPANYDHRFKGWMTARNALVTSRNVCSVRLAQAVGLGRVIEIAHRAGITSQLEPYPSLALGYCALSPMEVATAYATLARGGERMPTQLLRRIETETGDEYRTYNAAPSRCLPKESTLQLVDVLKDVVRHGTGTAAHLSGVEVAGKTGTADGARDVWFVGFTPEVVTAVWAGNEQNHKVYGHVTGGGVAAPIYRSYMTKFYQANKPQKRQLEAPEQRLLAGKPDLLANVAGESLNDYYSMLNASSRLNGLRAATSSGIASASMVQQLTSLQQARVIAMNNAQQSENNGGEGSEYRNYSAAPQAAQTTYRGYSSPAVIPAKMSTTTPAPQLPAPAQAPSSRSDKPFGTRDFASPDLTDKSASAENATSSVVYKSSMKPRTAAYRTTSYSSTWQ